MITLNNFQIQPTIFPDKTSQVWKLPPQILCDPSNTYTIEWTFEKEDELIHIAQLCTLIRKEVKSSFINLVCPYLPYARQHKEISNNATFALQTFCDIIDLYIDRLVVFDVHNYDFFFIEDRIPKWNFTLSNIKPKKEIQDCISRESINFIVFPDKGAAKRYLDLIGNIPFVSISKIREPLTGEITGLTMPDIPSAQNILVIDDLSDGARSHIEACKLINTFGPNKVVLYVSHGLFTKGTQIVYEAGYSAIYTKDGRL